MPGEIYVIFDGPPSEDGDPQIARRFVDVLDAEGRAATVVWSPSKDGKWRLGPFYTVAGSDLKEAEAKIKRLIEKGDAMMRAGDEHGALDENDRAFMETVHAWDKAKR